MSSPRLHHGGIVVAAVAALAAVAPGVARAQTPFPPAPAPIVESHPPRLQAPPPRHDRVKGKAEVSYVATTGNADTTSARVGGELQYKPGPWTLELKGAFLVSNDAKGRNHRIDGLLRSSRKVVDGVELFGQVVYLKNTFAGIDDSFYPLGGVAYALVDTAPQSLQARVGLGYGQESRLRRPDLNFATADAQTAYRWTLSKTAEFREDAVFTRNLSRGADWRFANTTSIAAALNSLISLKVSHALNFLNEPVAGFERVDTVTSAALVATF